MNRAESEFADRLRKIRIAVYGEEITKVAGFLGVPPRTWENYESGVTIPGIIALRFVVLTAADPLWLLTGSGEPYTKVDATPGVAEAARAARSVLRKATRVAASLLAEAALLAETTVLAEAGRVASALIPGGRVVPIIPPSV